MPWKGLRQGHSSELDLHRHSTLDAARGERLRIQTIQEAGASDSSFFLSPTDSTAMIDDGNVDLEHSRTQDVEPHQQFSNHKRFSLLKFKHASDPNISSSFSRQEPPPPPVPATPAIITTSPTTDSLGRPTKKKQKPKIIARSRPATDGGQSRSSRTSFTLPKRNSIFGALTHGFGEDYKAKPPHMKQSHVTFDEPGMLSATSARGAPPAYGDESNSTLAVPVSRLSESSRSDRSSGDQITYATTTTTHTISTTTTFFRLPRRKKEKGSLFPLPLRIQNDENLSRSDIRLSVGSTSARNSESSQRHRTLPFEIGPDQVSNGSGFQTPVQSALAMSSTEFAIPGAPLIRQGSKSSIHSTASSSNGLAPNKPRGRVARSSTMGSATDGAHSIRTSTSTSGRKSFGDLFSLSRLRGGPEVSSSRHLPCGITPSTPGSSRSKSNSFSINREAPLSYPEREEGDTPVKYLERLQEAVPRSLLASVLSKSSDDFSRNTLRSYMRKFSFFGDPMDMAIRKLLMEIELPKETQQIDRVLQGFADRYHECNPGIFGSSDQAYFIAFSLLILHTDVFNKNNKRKMQRQDYVKNTAGEGIASDILECFYDNISYTPFIHVDDDVDIRGERHSKSRKGLFKPGSMKSNSSEVLRVSPKEPVDPYTLILENRLDSLRPSLRDVMNLEDPYNYLGTADGLDIPNLHASFLKCGVLQIVSQRSRPDAFASQAQNEPGVVSLKVAKVGLLWRKDLKKRRGRSPWSEWGAILTGLQVYFFRDTNWVKSLVTQYDNWKRSDNGGRPVVFEPRLFSFNPDNQTSTADAVALIDSSYRKHKNAFVVFRHGGFEETFLANSEGEMNDWLAKLNYAAAFRTAGVRIRGSVGRGYESDHAASARPSSTRSVQGPTGDVTIHRPSIDTAQIQEIMEQRRKLMLQKIKEADEKLEIAHKQLDTQLRNARHLQILSPILPKTREQVLHAAGRMSAKLKWVRMEIWRMKCHKVILTMDLDQEEKDIRNHPLLYRSQSTHSTTPTNHSDSKKLDNVECKSSKSAKPSRHMSATSPSSLIDDNDFDAPESTVSDDLSRTSSRQIAQKSWDAPTVNFDSQRSITSIISDEQTPKSPSSPRLSQHPRASSITSKSDHISEDRASSRAATPTPSVDLEEQRMLEENKLIDASEATPIPSRPETANGNDFNRSMSVSSEKDGKEDRSKMRRSLHKTLRNSTASSHTAHHRSRKGKDSISSAVTDDVASLPESEGLTRKSGSFRFHGKKASVVTFGPEWQGSSPEERLKLWRQSQSEELQLKDYSNVDDAASEAPIANDDGDLFVAEADDEFEQRSIHSTSFTTARSSQADDSDEESASVFETMLSSAPVNDFESETGVEVFEKPSATGVEEEDGAILRSP